MLDGPPVPATMQLTQMEVFHTAGSPDSAGRIYTDTCKLAAPVEVPLGLFGKLDVSRKKKLYAVVFLLGSENDVALDCVESVTGPHRGEESLSFMVGTHEFGVLFEGLPLTDPAHLVATHAMVPGAGHGVEEHPERAAVGPAAAALNRLPGPCG